MKVGELCRRPAITADPSATLADIRQLMSERRVNAVVITRTVRLRPIPIGIVTDRDIENTQREYHASLASFSAEDAMTPDPLVLSAELSLSQAVQQLQARGVRHAPVLNARGLLIGIVCIDELLPQLAEELAGMACLLAHGPADESAQSAHARAR